MKKNLIELASGLIVFTSLLTSAYAAESATFAVCAIIPSVPGVNAPLNGDDKITVSEIAANQPQSKTENQILLVENETPSGNVQTIYSR